MNYDRLVDCVRVHLSGRWVSENHKKSLCRSCINDSKRNQSFTLFNPIWAQRWLYSKISSWPRPSICLWEDKYERKTGLLRLPCCSLLYGCTYSNVCLFLQPLELNAVLWIPPKASFLCCFCQMDLMNAEWSNPIRNVSVKSVRLWAYAGN